MTLIGKCAMAGAAAVVLAGLALFPGAPAAATASLAAMQEAPYAYCWTRRDTGAPGANTYYFSRLFAMGRDGPTIGFQPSFQSFVSARYTSAGQSSGATCMRLFGRRAAEDNMNNRIGGFRRSGARIVMTNWAG